MSIASEVNRIKNEVSTQTSLIAQIQTALEGKAAGGELALQEKFVIPTTLQQTVTPDAGYDGLSKVTVDAMPTVVQATPTISVSDGGVITASSTQSAAGYVSGGTKTATKQLPTQTAQTITPGTSNKYITGQRYLTGAQTIKGDANLIGANIVKGKTIFGVSGTHECDVGNITYTESENDAGGITVTIGGGANARA